MIGPFPISPTLIDGGASSALMYLCDELVKNPTVQLIGVRLCDSTTMPDSDDLFSWPMRNIFVRRFGLARLYRAELMELCEILDSFQPDIVHAQGIDLPGFISVRCGTPALVTVHGIPEQEIAFNSTLRGRLREYVSTRLISRTTLARARHIVSINPYVNNYYADQLAGEVFEIANPVSEMFFRLQRRPEKGRVLYAGRVIPRKGILDLILAFASLKDLDSKLILAGACPDARYLEQVKAEIIRQGLTGRIELRGHLLEAEVLEEFSVAEALVLPSYQETAPMVIQQAMAAGLPVVASNVCGIPSQIRQGIDGLLFTPGDPAELGSSLRKILDDVALAQFFGMNARERAKQAFRSSEVAKATIAAYHMVSS